MYTIDFEELSSILLVLLLLCLRTVNIEVPKHIDIHHMSWKVYEVVFGALLDLMYLCVSSVWRNDVNRFKTFFCSPFCRRLSISLPDGIEVT
jgi:hypothetical protein